MTKARRPPVIIATILLALASSPFLAFGAERGGDYDAARSNPVLREALATNSPYTNRYRGSLPREQVRDLHEAWVDAKIVQFVHDLHQKMDDLRTAVQRAKTARLDLVSGGSEAEAKFRLKEALKEAERKSRSVRTEVEKALLDLPTHYRPTTAVPSGSKNRWFEDEMLLLSSDFKLADQAVADYFFKPTHVTSVTELREANMLDYLWEIEKVSRAIRLAL